MDLPTESELGILALESWPSEGTIDISGLVATYDKSLPPILKDLSLSVAARQRVGIVGRTGAGKSSLASAIFRFIEPMKGCIKIDEFDISTLKLRVLLSRMCIVSQDLSTLISDGGANLSQGQRQLICLARAILDKPRIVLLDVATSSVDQETDTVIQRVLRREFSNSTCIVIAHRLSSVADFDNLLVLDQRRIGESGSPVELLQSKGLYWDFVCQSSERTLIKSIILNNSNR